MPGRHAAPSRRSGRRSSVRLAGAHAVVMLPCLLAASLAGWAVAAGDDLLCGDRTTLTLAASPEIAPAVEAVVAELDPSDVDTEQGCAHVEVVWTDPDDVLAGLHAGAPVPDLWIPDTSAWLSRLPSSVPDRRSWSLAKTPVVLVGPAATARPTTWLGALSAPGAELLDPRTSGASVGALAALQAEAARGRTSSGSLARWLVDEAQAAPEYSLSDADLLNNAANGGTAAPAWFPTTEQRFIDQFDEVRGNGLTAVVPESGTTLLDYPLTAVARGPDATAATEAAEVLARHLRSQGRQSLVNAGFRVSSGRPTELEGSVGPVSQIGPHQPTQAGELLRSWVSLTTDARMLAVLDVSGSMYADAGGRTRIELARDAMLTALRSVPDGWKLGLWAFSHELGPGGTDHRVLVPDRPLSAWTGGTMQRSALTRAIRGLPALVGGGTGLYDTVLAAYRSAVAGYEAGKVNSVVLFTDGRNDDPDGRSLSQLLDELARLEEHRKPVQLITVGMGPEVDAVALRRIAAATGGASYLARDPEAIAGILNDALLERVGWQLRSLK